MSAPATFRKRPLIVEAYEWRAHDWSKPEDAVVRYFRRPDVDGKSVCPHCEWMFDHHGWVDTLEGGHVVCPGDWIIKGVKGEFYPCKPAIFEETYEPVAGVVIA